MDNNRKHNETDNTKLINKEKQIIWYKASLIAISIIVTFIISSIFYYRDDAWLFLSFVGTGSSLILSVIAILITLVDVAGQKGQVLEIAESTKKLRKSLKEQKEISDENLFKQETLMTEYKEILEVLINEKLANQVEEFRISVDEMFDNLKDKIPEETLREIKAEVNDVKSNFQNVNQHYYPLETVVISMDTDKEKGQIDTNAIHNELKKMGYSKTSIHFKDDLKKRKVILRVSIPKGMNYEDVLVVRYKLHKLLKKYV